MKQIYAVSIHYTIYISTGCPRKKLVVKESESRMYFITYVPTFHSHFHDRLFPGTPFIYIVFVYCIYVTTKHFLNCSQDCGLPNRGATANITKIVGGYKTETGEYPWQV